MRILNCLIIEDEPLAALVIQDYIEQVPGLRLTGICEDIFSANERLREERIDILFLDIKLPKVSGLEFMKTLSPKYHVILTTAYHQYALDGFDLNATDYLLKPVAFSRFLQAINKVYEKERKMPGRTVAVAAEEKYYFFNTDKKKVKVYADDIDYIESLKDYVSIHSKGRTIVTKFQIGELEKFLEEGRFLRIHRSFIINIAKVTAYSATEVEIGEQVLPLGRSYKELVERILAR